MHRRLEVGPGRERLPGFETIDIMPGPFVDHVGDAQKLPFADQTFDMVYSCHSLEHFDWWLVEGVVAEWTRVLKPGGNLTIHTVDATPLMRALIQWEETGVMDRQAGKWKVDLHRGDPVLAAAGRLFNYPKDGNQYHRHRTIIVPRYLRQCMERAGLHDIRDAGEPLGRSKHHMVNFGLTGVK